MAIEAIAAVWRYSQASGAQLLVMLAVADRARREDGLAWPGLKALGEQTRLSRRTLQRHLHALIEAGELELVSLGSGRKSNHYRVNLGDYMQDCGGVNLAPQGRQLRHPTGATDGTPGAPAATPNPSDDPSLTKQPPAFVFDAAPYVDIWRERYGGEPPGSFFKVMKQLEAEHGPTKTYVHLGNFLASLEPRFVNAGTPAKFASTFGSWDQRGVGNGKPRPTRSTEGVVRFDD